MCTGIHPWSQKLPWCKCATRIHFKTMLPLAKVSGYHRSNQRMLIFSFSKRQPLCNIKFQHFLSLSFQWWKPFFCCCLFTLSKKRLPPSFEKCWQREKFVFNFPENVSLFSGKVLFSKKLRKWTQYLQVSPHWDWLLNWMCVSFAA